MRVYGASEIGLVRKENQDAFIIGEGDNFAYAVVCDGMGGANGGAVASDIAADIVAKRITVAEKSSDLKYVLLSAIDAANIAVYDKSREVDSLEGMGTTIVAAVVRDGTLYLAHAGDSRAYLFNGTELEQITRDHSVVQELLESGELTPDQALTYPNKNLITRALGVAAELEADYTEYYLPKDYSILLCTDGVTNLVTGSELAGFMEKPPDEAVKSIIALAVERGGTDNATAVVISGSSMEGQING